MCSRATTHRALAGWRGGALCVLSVLRDRGASECRFSSLWPPGVRATPALEPLPARPLLLTPTCAGSHTAEALDQADPGDLSGALGHRHRLGERPGLPVVRRACGGCVQWQLGAPLPACRPAGPHVRDRLAGLLRLRAVRGAGVGVSERLRQRVGPDGRPLPLLLLLAHALGRDGGRSGDATPAGFGSGLASPHPHPSPSPSPSPAQVGAAAMLPQLGHAVIGGEALQLSVLTLTRTRTRTLARTLALALTLTLALTQTRRGAAA